MTNNSRKFKGNIQECLPYEHEAKRFYKLKKEDFHRMIRTWLNNS